MKPGEGEDNVEDNPIEGLSGLRAVEAPPSLLPAVMRRIAEPRPLPQPWWARLLPWRRLGAELLDSRPIAGLSRLREVTPPPSLVPAVMNRIAEPRAQTFWSWLWRPRSIQVRLSPMTALAGVVGVAVAVASFTLARPSVQRVQPPTAGARAPISLAAATAPPAQEVVLVRFVLVAKGARKVAVAGDWNGWSAEGTTLENADGQGTFIATVPLPRGAHEYMFLVDGAWVTDPAAPETRPDGFGRSNAILRL